MLAWYFFWFMLRPTFRVVFRLDLKGTEHLPPGPHIVAANHRSHVDPVLLGTCYPPWRRIHYMAKEELFKVPVLGRLIKILGAFPVKRGAGDERALAKAEELIRKGKVVGMFPEGERQPPQQRDFGRARTGTVRLAMKLGVPILPVYIEGTEKVLSKGSTRLRRAKLKVRFGPPLSFSADPDKLTREELQARADQIRQAWACLREGG